MSQGSRKRVAFVVPRFGKEIHGGAEKLALSLATRLAAHYEVHVLTTCAKDYRTWKNAYDPGVFELGELTVRRFRVDSSRNEARFNSLSRRVRDTIQSLSLDEQEGWLREQGPYSTGLLTFLSQEQQHYDAIIFLPYLYATTYFGLPLAGDRAILMPLAHDEWPIYLSAWDRLFAQARECIFVTEEERDLVSRRFPALPAQGPVALSGIDALAGDPLRFRSDFNVNTSFALYLGRVDESKGCARLAADFAACRKTSTFPEKLVFVGPSHMRLRGGKDIVICGEVDEQTKWDALSACEFLVMPSSYESLSFAVLEAWTCGKPVLVNARSPVLVAHCRKSNGGLWYSNAEEFAKAAKLLDGPVGQALGRQGNHYVLEHFSWERSVAAVAGVIETMPRIR